MDINRYYYDHSYHYINLYLIITFSKNERTCRDIKTKKSKLGWYLILTT